MIAVVTHVRIKQCGCIVNVFRAIVPVCLVDKDCDHVGVVWKLLLQQWGDVSMWVDYRGPLSTVYNDGEISTCG